MRICHRVTSTAIKSVQIDKVHKSSLMNGLIWHMVMCGRSGVKSAIFSTLCPACHKQEQKHEIALRNVGSQLSLHVLWVFISNIKNLDTE